MIFVLTRLPVIVSEWVDPTHHLIGGSWDLLRRLSYFRAKRVIVQTQRNLEYYPRFIRRIARVIPNPVMLPKEVRHNAPRHSTGGSKVIIAMGRLVEQKGFDLLLAAFGWPQTPLVFQLVRQAVYLDEAAFRQFALNSQDSAWNPDRRPI